MKKLIPGLVLFLIPAIACADTELIIADGPRVVAASPSGGSAVPVYDFTAGLAFIQSISAYDANNDLFLLNLTAGNTYDILRAKVNGGTAPIPIVQNISSAGTIDVDQTNAKIYWSDFPDPQSLSGPRRLRRANLDGSAAETIYNGTDIGVGPLGVTVDPTTGKVYWTDPVMITIERSNLDGTGQEFLYLDAPCDYGIVVDPVNQDLFWTDQSQGRIFSAKADGSSSPFRPIFVGLGSVFNLEVDPVAGKLYWTDTIAVFRGNLDGTGAETLVQSPDVFAPFSLTLAEGIPPLTTSTVLTAPPIVKVANREVTVIVKEFDGSSLALTQPLLGDTLPLLSSSGQVRYQATLNNTDGSSSSYFTKVSKSNEINFKNVPPGQWIATFRAVIVKKRSKDSIAKLQAKFESQLAKAKPGTKKFVVLKEQKLKLEKNFKIAFSTNESPPAAFEVGG